MFPKEAVEPGDLVLELERFGCSRSGVHDVSLTVRAGEIVGLAGLVGAGRTELARALFGVTPADQGRMTLSGRAVRIQSPAEAIARGLAYLPEDRRRHGVILPLPIASNITLASLDRISGRSGAIDFRREKETALDYVRRLGIKTPALFVPVASLSGGNQQKVALARWLVTRPSLLVLDEPTQGIDVGAKSEIHALISQLAAEGTAILLISSELPEVLGMSDRIAVMRAGTVVTTIARAASTPEAVMAAAFGHPGEVAASVPAAPA